MKNKLTAILGICLLLNSASAQTTLNGVTLPAKLKQENTELMLNGGGIRTKLFFKLYTAGLYVTVKSKNGNEIAAADKAVAMRLTITSGMISSDNMSEAVQEGFEKSMKGNTAPLQPKITEFMNSFKKEPIKEKDVFEMWYLPGVGVNTYKNGKLQTTISGLDFKKALFGMWLGDNPVDEDMKEGLLGL